MPVRAADPLLRFGDQVETTSTVGEEMGAMFGEAVQSGPIGSLWRMAELEQAEQGIAQDNSAMLAKAGVRTARAPDSPKLSQADARQRVKDAGLDGSLDIPVAGMRSRTLEILVARKQAELRRQTILQQSPGGAGRVSARVAAGLVGSLVDPANVALAFVPVVGQARYAAWLRGAGGAFGRTAVRGSVGAVEGVVGAALVEPLNYAANQQQQADYDAYDAMLNIAGGAFFGTALHAGAGLFGDMLRPGRWAAQPKPRPERTSEPQGAIDPAMPPRPGEGPRALEIDAAARERAIVLDRLAEGRPLTREDAVLRAMDTLRTDIEADLLARASGVAEPGTIAAARAELAAVTRELDAFDTAHRQRIKDANARPGVTRKQAEALAGEQSADLRADLLGRKARAEALITANKAGSDAVAALSALRKGEVPDDWRARVEAEADRLLGSDGQAPLSAAVRKAIETDPFRNVRPALAQLPPEVQQDALRMALAQAVTGRPIDITPALLAHHGDLPGALAAAGRNAGEIAGADRVASQAADLRLKDLKADDIGAMTEAANEAEALVRDQARAAGLADEEIAAMLDDAEAATRDATRRVSAFKIAALCALRAG